MSLVVEENYAFGVPQTTVPGWSPPGVGAHWSAGGPGRAGWEGTIRHLINTRGTVNASYHGGFWGEHDAAHRACQTIIQWIVPTTKAAHSIAPSQVFKYHPTKDRALQDARFAEVRRILGAKAADPNAGCIAVAYAGMPADLAKDVACPVFVADVQNLGRQLVAHPAVIDRPHFGHGWIQPIDRYEMDAPGVDLIALLYATPAPVQEEVQMELRVHAVEWNTKPNAPFWTHGPGVGPQKNIEGVAFVDSIARSEPDGWRLVRLPRSVFVWMRGEDLVPTEPGGDPEYHNAVVRVMNIGAEALEQTGVPEPEVVEREKLARAAGIKAAAANAAATT